VDFNWYGICALRALHLVWDVKAPTLKEAIKSKPGLQQLTVSTAASGDD